MLVKLAALGALGYAGYRYLQKNQAVQGGGSGSTGHVALAGGPLSDQARIQSDPDAPPASSSAAADVLRTMP
ncbi:uncharacterized membrane protein YebE (DUF533 family) [Novosphingobium chloroacetimidivorans]|uniref:Uncharacterized membrane protein YebE (DUF533 family) n=1 Tax=Novosphingobium chloroacetimidivorans TaxID=1428314 RepID=A0A7W7K9X9_9SPHN|nr:hypothetical protein [Novosphingobium chloroacetimidivorans]MBB4858705.1 uncharacterized membrane protein YebE (DUF533 family) [Novosphingobium chloroacetimidivorans]